MSESERLARKLVEWDDCAPIPPAVRIEVAAKLIESEIAIANYKQMYDSAVAVARDSIQKMLLAEDAARIGEFHKAEAQELREKLTIQLKGKP